MLFYSGQKDIYTPVKGIEMKLTSQCNYRCSFCSNEDGKVMLNEPVQVEAMTRALKELGEADRALSMFDEIYFTGGEPLLVLESLLEIAQSLPKSVSIHLSTNGLFLEQKVLDRLLQVGLAGIKLSYDTASPTQLPRIRAGAKQEDLERIEANIKYALSKGVSVYLRTTVGRNNIAELPTIYRRAKALGVTTLQVKPIVASGRARPRMGRIAVSESEFTDILALLAFSYDEENLPVVVHCFPPAKLLNFPVSPCANAEKLYIMPKGDIYICNFMTSPEERLGNCLQAGGMTKALVSRRKRFAQLFAADGAMAHCPVRKKHTVRDQQALQVS